MIGSKKTVLIVEDNELDRRILERILKKKKFSVIALSDGSNCLEVVKLRRPDIVLMDILMPNLHGNQLLHLLRETYSAIELPILMTTVKGDSSNVIESLALGANDYIVKPIDFEVAITRINTQLTIVEHSRELARLRTFETIAAMIATYNHEINNPLAIAVSSLKRLEALREDKGYKRLEGALWKIADIVKQLNGIIETSGIELEDYRKNPKMLKLK